MFEINPKGIVKHYKPKITNRKINFSHNKIHKVLLEHGLANENKEKKKRRKAWIRYERKHSLTAMHLDWHTSKVNGKEVCVVQDDSSRCILAGGEFEAATTEKVSNYSA